MTYEPEPTAQYRFGLNVEMLLASVQQNREFAAWMVMNYRKELEVDVPAIRESIHNQEWKAAAEHIHRIKSGGRYLGLEALADAAWSLQQTLSDKTVDPAAVDAAWAPFERSTVILREANASELESLITSH